MDQRLSWQVAHGDGVANVPGHDNDINLAISSLIAAPATEQCSVGGAAQGRVAKACAKHQ